MLLTKAIQQLAPFRSVVGLSRRERERDGGSSIRGDHMNPGGPAAARGGSSWCHAIGGVQSIHGLAASNAAAARKMSDSRYVFATNCNPTGRPSPVKPTGNEAAG